jgi:methylmalonyl-CoA/ethylmalonyl-CoA epimerase
MMDTQFAKFLQIGIIVEDVEETIKNYEKLIEIFHII